MAWQNLNMSLIVIVNKVQLIVLSPVVCNSIASCDHPDYLWIWREKEEL